MSPRRSSRARTSQLPPSVIASHSTSSSSTSSARPERAMRASSNKQASPRKSASPQSLSSEDPHPAPPLTRRRTRELDPDDNITPKIEDVMEDDEDEQEVTRCVCTLKDYPGPPAVAGRAKDGQDTDMQPEEGAFYIQCDTCHVWQHGQCVGIMDEASTPDEYFCEECRKDLHKLMTDSRGQKYSRYLPVYELLHAKSARKSSVSKETESKSARDKDRNARGSAESLGKRRSTMNSRAAYDEDEVLRKVLEESKHEGGAPQSENGNRKKRSRDDSEESKPGVKRQRTTSRSPSNSPVVESEDDTIRPTAAKQKPRGAAARSQREKELRDKERERERLEAANRRKGRAERRKIEEAELAEAAAAEESTMPSSVSEPPPPDTPPVDLKPAPAPRKSGRPPQKRQGRLGRNQYSKDGQPTTNGASPAANGDTPNSPQIGITNGVNNGHDSSDAAAGQKPAKSRNWRLDKLSWNEIRRPAGAMQNYITQRQVEMAGDKSIPAPPVRGLTPVNGERDPAGGDTMEAFKKLSTLQMMDDLSRDLVHWQQMVAQQTEK